MTRRPIVLLGALLILGMSAEPDAIEQQATIEGDARAEESGAPVQFALVRLVRADSSALPSDSPPQGITNTDGRYRFDGVTPGRYRVQLLRIGFRPVLSDPVQLVASETVQLDLRVASQPLVLPAGNRHSGSLRDGEANSRNTHSCRRSGNKRAMERRCARSSWHDSATTCCSMRSHTN